jgi:hypothetical protein
MHVVAIHASTNYAMYTHLRSPCSFSIAGEVEDAANAGRPDLSALPACEPGGDAPRLPLGAAVCRGMSRVVSPQVFLTVIADR